MVILILGILFAAAGLLSAAVTLGKKGRNQKAHTISSISFMVAGLLLIAAYFVIYH